jgi:HEAT repeat protein
LLLGLAASAPPAFAQSPELRFEQVIADLANDDPEVRLRAARLLTANPYAEAALPLARAVVDADDAVQAEAIAAELNLHLAEPIVPRRRVGFIVELRNDISAPEIFRQGSAALDARPVDMPVLSALRTAAHDEHPRVASDALYAFGALAGNAYGSNRSALLSTSGNDLAATLGSERTEVRLAALRAIARVYEWRAGDPGIPQVLGDAVVTMLNDRSFNNRLAAIDALGAMRYERGVDALTGLFEHYQHGTVAAAALSALGRVAHPSSEETFVRALASRDPVVRRAAIEGLARLGAVSRLPAIRSATAAERDEEVLLAAHFAGVLLNDGPVDALVEGLTHPRTRQRSVRYIADAMAGRTAIFRPHMPDPNPAVRADLVDAAGLSGDPAAAALIEPLRGDEDPVVQRAVQRALARLGAADPVRP